MEKYKEVNGITYMLVGKLYLPTLLPPQEKASPLGIWGKRRLAYLKQHHRETFSYLLTSGQLNAHLAYADERAKDMYSILVKQFAVSDGVTEDLKTRDRKAWEGRMNNIAARARKLVYDEVINV